MKYPVRSLAFFIFALQFSLSAQQSDLLFNRLTLEDGLSELTNNYIYRDSRGFVWISSISGLNCFNGTGVKVYLPNESDSTSIYGENIQSNFYEDDSCRIWFCTYVAINCYNPSKDNFSHYILTDSAGKEMAGYHVFFLDNAHNLWFLVQDRYIYTLNTLTHEFNLVHTFPQVALRAIPFQQNGALQTIYAYKPGRAGLHVINIGNDHSVVHDTILYADASGRSFIPKQVLIESDSIIWLTCPDQLARYSMKSGTGKFRSVEKITCTQHLNDSILLVSIAGHGIWELNKWSGNLRPKYRHDHANKAGLLSNTVNFIIRDNHNGLWFSCTGLGICYATPGKKKFNLTLAQNSEPDFQPLGMYEFGDGKIFCCAYNGKFYELNRKGDIIRELNNKTVDSKIPSQTFQTFSDKNKNVWIPSMSGLFFWNASNQHVSYLSNQTFWGGVETAEGRIILAGTPEGMFEAFPENDSYIVSRIYPDRFVKEYVMIGLDSKGMLWINEEILKILVLDPSSFKVVAEIPVKGITTDLIESPDGKTGWLAVNTGLYEIDMADYSVRKIHNSVPGGCTSFNNMLEDSNGFLWLSCRNQIIRFDPVQKQFNVYNTEDGLQSEQYTMNASQRFENGEMWFGFAGGFTSFIPEKIKSLTIEAIPQITSIEVNDGHYTDDLVCLNNGSTHISEIEKLKFSHQHNTLAFVINSLEYSAPDQNKVLYKLEGVDKDWVEVRSGSTVRYPSLPSGKFRFVVKASNSDGIYNNKARELEIIIIPPFWKTWWFISLLFIAIISIAAYIVYLNLSKTIELQKVRLGLYENLHDDIGSRLTAVVMNAEEVLRQDATGNPKLLHLTNIAKSIVGNMRRLVWAIDPENDKMENLAAKIRHDKNLILGDTIQFTLDVPEEMKHLIIPGEVRYQITSIINEALTNISKYANANHVIISFRHSNKQIHLTITDDGQGFDPLVMSPEKRNGAGYGLSNMRKRIERVKGNIIIHSSIGQGTVIEAKIPV